MPLFRLNPDATESVFLRQRTVDPFGHRLHAIIAAIWCFCACGPASAIELGMIPIAACYVIRLPRHARVGLRLIHLPGPQLTILWLAWLAISVSWSLDRTLGLEEFAACRFAGALLLLWPVMDRRGWLIAGLCAGFAAAIVAQVFHAVGTHFGIDAITFPRMPHRNSGWWQPVVGGSMLTAALGLHLPAMLTGRGWTRITGILGSIASLVGVLATGSRGAWLAAGALCIVALVWASARASWRILRWGHAPLIIAALLVVAFAAHRTVGPGVIERGKSGFAEVRHALSDHNYSTDTGARLLMARVALDAVAQHPAHGIGAGSFRQWGMQHLTSNGEPQNAKLLHDHSHNAFLHVAATTGLIGLAIFGALVAVAIRGGLWRLPASPGYAAGPAFAMIGLVLVSPFDVFQINSQTAALFWILFTICLWGRPSESRERLVTTT